MPQGAGGGKGQGIRRRRRRRRRRRAASVIFLIEGKFVVKRVGVSPQRHPALRQSLTF